MYQIESIGIGSVKTDVKHREDIFRFLYWSFPFCGNVTLMQAETNRSTVANGEGETEGNELGLH